MLKREPLLRIMQPAQPPVGSDADDEIDLGELQNVILQHRWLVAVAFLIVRAEYSTALEVRDALAKLRNSGVAGAVKGAIFNGVRGRRIGYGQSYKAYYSYQ